MILLLCILLNARILDLTHTSREVRDLYLGASLLPRREGERNEQLRSGPETPPDNGHI